VENTDDVVLLRAAAHLRADSRRGCPKSPGAVTVRNP
jgi:hypothetical protein